MARGEDRVTVCVECRAPVKLSEARPANFCSYVGASSPAWLCIWCDRGWAVNNLHVASS